jgi:hypothetical protein
VRGREPPEGSRLHSLLEHPTELGQTERVLRATLNVRHPGVPDAEVARRLSLMFDPSDPSVLTHSPKYAGDLPTWQPRLLYAAESAFRRILCLRNDRRNFLLVVEPLDMDVHPAAEGVWTTLRVEWHREHGGWFARRLDHARLVLEQLEVTDEEDHPLVLAEGGFRAHFAHASRMLVVGLLSLLLIPLALATLSEKALVATLVSIAPLAANFIWELLERISRALTGKLEWHV